MNMKRTLSTLLACLLLLTACGEAVPKAPKRDHSSSSSASDNSAQDSGPSQSDGSGSQSPRQEDGSGSVPESEAPLPLINFSYQTDGGKEYANIIAFSQDGVVLWEYTTPQLEIAQLERVADIGLAGDGYCFVFDQSVVCLDARTGAERWKNSDFGGAGARSVIGSGVIYLCGFLGPDLFALSFSGETVKRISSLDDNYFWPYQLELSGDILTVTMDGGPEGDLETGHPIHVNVTDWSVEAN